MPGGYKAKSLGTELSGNSLTSFMRTVVLTSACDRDSPRECVGGCSKDATAVHGAVNRIGVSNSWTDDWGEMG
jgi:hypothetical protein